MVLVASCHSSSSDHLHNHNQPIRQQQQQHRVTAHQIRRDGHFNCVKHNNKEPSDRCCCCCSCFASEQQRRNCVQAAKVASYHMNSNKTIKNHDLDYKSSSDKMCKLNKKSPKLSKEIHRGQSNQQQQQQQQHLHKARLDHRLAPQIECAKLSCSATTRPSKQLALIGCQADSDTLLNCAKCQLIARWTSAQARLTRSAKRISENASQISKSSGRLNLRAADKLLCPMRTISEHWRQPAADSRRRSESSGDLRELARPRDCAKRQQAPPIRAKMAYQYYLSRSKLACNRQAVNEEEEEEAGPQGRSPALPSIEQRYSDNLDEDEEAEISSLTDSSIDGRESGPGEMQVGRDLRDDNLSLLSSCYDDDHDDDNEEHIEKPARQQLKGATQAGCTIRPPSFRAMRRPQTTVKLGIGGRKLRPAPLPPAKGACSSEIGRSARNKKQQLMQLADAGQRVGCDHSLDSGNSSGGENTNAGLSKARLSAQVHLNGHSSNREATCQATDSRSHIDDEAISELDHRDRAEIKPDLLTEAEVFSIEHFLRSHKSSIYVCGCMANLYLTSTQLVDNGRCSMPSSDGWQLSRTGVPVLTFDSGLTRNRNKRRLSINLAERGSGFVLWSDIIDHLSNYRAYQTTRTTTTATTTTTTSSSSYPTSASSSIASSRLLSSPTSSSLSSQAQQQQQYAKPDEGPSCDTFHVMYLSTNHRIMVGLSFDDAKCARLFLRQVELVTSDPANISLTGPKFARRLASVGRFSRLLTPKAKNHGADKHQARSRRRSKPVLLANDQISEPQQQQQLRQQQQHQWYQSVESRDTELQVAKPSKLRSIIRRRSEIKQSIPPRIMTSCSSQHRFSTGVDYTWSTLKRAIRFGQQQHAVRSRQRSAKQIGLDHQEGSALEQDDGAGSSSLEPKPMASLAMSGKVYRAGKKMPRKCDISAPCLFQHVTSVDLNGLERLYSRSLVQSVANEQRKQQVDPKSCIECNTSSSCNHDHDHQQHKETSSSGLNMSTSTSTTATAQNHQQAAKSNRPTSIASKPLKVEKLSQISSSDGSYSQPIHQNGRQVADQHSSASVTTSTNTTTSSSSCYSSASISPASSECGARTRNQRYQRHQQQQQRNPTRPTPPKVPQRVSSTEPAVGQLAVQRHHLNQQQQQQDQVGPANANKIQAIIRELQAQTSAELVDAKRKLMADIADQVLARATTSSSSASSSSSSRSISISTSLTTSPEGAVSRL